MIHQSWHGSETIEVSLRIQSLLPKYWLVNIPFRQIDIFSYGRSLSEGVQAEFERGLEGWLMHMPWPL